MKTADFLNGFKRARREVRSTARKAMFIKMVAQNIADLIPATWQMTNTAYGIRYKPIEGTVITPDVLDKLLAKLAKALNYEPSKSVSPDTITADFYVYPTAYNKAEWTEGVNIEFTIGNTEKCDFIVTQVTRDESEPTGYCKLLKEKKYLLKMEAN
jgi:hypothetical protein